VGAQASFGSCGCVCILVLFSPFFALVAAAIRLTSQGPVLFKQKRSLSDRSLVFEFYRFRTMKPGADLEKKRCFILRRRPPPRFR